MTLTNIDNDKSAGIQVLAHPLSQHLVTLLRDENTDHAEFRSLTLRLTTLLALEATSDMPTRSMTVNTPLESHTGTCLAYGLVVVPILRAGLGMLEPIAALFPDVSVGYIGLERDHETAVASSYYCKLPRPERIGSCRTLVVDPMLATGGTAVQAINLVKAQGATDIRLLCVVAAPEGVAVVNQAHPDVPVIGAALDRQLNQRKYILPGLGDFGDRLYGTL